MSCKLKLAFAMVAASSLTPVPIAAQSYSEGYKFLKAVKDRDGNAVESILGGAGARLVNTKDLTSGEAALHVLAKDRDLTWLRFMLAKGARPDLADKQGDTALTIATQLGWADGAVVLLRAGAKVDTPNGRGETPLILAVHKRDVAMIRLLMASGADPKRSDRIAGYSALDYAKRDDPSGTLLKLLEKTQPAKAVAGPPR